MKKLALLISFAAMMIFSGCASTTQGGAVGIDRSQFITVSEAEMDQSAALAYKQITAQAEGMSQRVYGLVFLDVSSCLGGIPKMELPNVEAAQWAIHESLEAFVARNASKIEQLAERFSEASLGVCLIGQAPIWTRDGTLYMAARTRVVAPQSLSDEDLNSLEKILSGFSGSMLSLV